jgi:DNA invertase Pin-like site-specific DNA recombinase
LHVKNIPCKINLQDFSGYESCAAMTQFVGYVRVSTKEQGESRLGIEAQTVIIAMFLQPGDLLIQPVFEEIQSGKKANRKVLDAAIARCRMTGSTLLVSKLDRLGRNVGLISAILDSGLPVCFADMPHTRHDTAAGRFILMSLANVAEYEAKVISERTKAALGALKARGVALGGDRGYRPQKIPEAFQNGPAASVAARQMGATRTAFALNAKIEAIRKANGDDMSLQALARALTEQGIATPRGGSTWTATAVRRVLARVAG